MDLRGPTAETSQNSSISSDSQGHFCEYSESSASNVAVDAVVTNENGLIFVTFTAFGVGDVKVRWASGFVSEKIPATDPIRILYDVRSEWVTIWKNIW